MFCISFITIGLRIIFSWFFRFLKCARTALGDEKIKKVISWLQESKNPL